MDQLGVEGGHLDDMGEVCACFLEDLFQRIKAAVKSSFEVFWIVLILLALQRGDNAREIKRVACAHSRSVVETVICVLPAFGDNALGIGFRFCGRGGVLRLDRKSDEAEKGNQ